MKNTTLAGLVELGLTDKEALLYSSALKVGAATIQQLALETGINRATLYGCVDTLVEKGLLHIKVQGVRKLFVPEPPEKLKVLLDYKQQALSNIMPSLTHDYLQMAAGAAENSIRMYYGTAGVKLLYETILDTLKPGDEYLVISDHEKWQALEPVFFEKFIQKRAALDLDIKLILQHTESALAFKQQKNLVKTQIKLLPKQVDLNTNMIILPDRVIIVQMVEPILVIIIENKNVTAMNKILFSTIWNLLTADKF